MTTIDDQVQQAGSRLAELPVRAPEPGRLVAHRRRTRSLAAVGAVALLAATAATVEALHHGRHDRITTSASTPADDDAFGLTWGALWSGEGQGFPSPADAGEDFAEEVLGWSEPEADVRPQGDGDLAAEVTVEDRTTGRSLELLATALGDGWEIVQVGGDGAIGAMHRTATGAQVEIAPSPPGTVSVRWWALTNGREISGRAPDPDGSLQMPVAIDDLGSMIVLYLDDQGRPLGAAGNAMGDGSG
jgi:hypothetical protein